MYAGAAVVYSAARLAALGHFSAARHLWKIQPKIIAAAVGLLGQHAKLFFWPIHLNVFHNFDPGPSLRSPWPWLALLALAAAIIWGRIFQRCGAPEKCPSAATRAAE